MTNQLKLELPGYEEEAEVLVEPLKKTWPDWNHFRSVIMLISHQKRGNSP